MATKIGHASIDENRRARGGAAGDQTGREVCTRDWYNKPWIAVIRPNDATVAEKIAKAMEQACANNNIGYDQNQRTTLYTQAKAKKWDIPKIAVKCETDCSALVAVCVNAAGITVSKDIYTGNEKQALVNTGKFKALIDEKYLSSGEYLKRGDILLGSGHTAVVLSNGSKIVSNTPEPAEPQKPQTVKIDPAKSFDKNIAGTYVVTADVLNIRAGAGTNKTDIGDLKKGTKAACYGYYTKKDGVKWFLVVANGVTGYVASKYLKK